MRWRAAVVGTAVLALSAGCDSVFDRGGPESEYESSSSLIESRSRSSGSNISTVTAPNRACGEPSTPVVTVEPFGSAGDSPSSSSETNAPDSKKAKVKKGTGADQTVEYVETKPAESRQGEASDEAAGLRPSEFDGEVEVSRAGDGWNVDVSGAPFGEVVRAVGNAADRSVAARGTGTRVPVYARIRNRAARPLLEEIARTVGMRAVSAEESTYILDAAEAVSLERRLARSDKASPELERRVYDAPVAARQGDMLAELALSCRGKIVVIPTEDKLVVEDVPSNFSSIETWLERMQADEFEELEETFEMDRRPRRGVPDPAVPTCRVRTSGSTEGVAVGRLLVERAQKRGADVIAGCGSHRRVSAPVREFPDGEAVASTLQMERLEDGAFAATEYVRRVRDVPSEPSTGEPWKLRAFEQVGGTAQEYLRRHVPGFQVLLPGHATWVAAPRSSFDTLEGELNFFREKIAK